MVTGCGLRAAQAVQLVQSSGVSGLRRRSRPTNAWYYDPPSHAGLAENDGVKLGIGSG